MRYLGLQRRGRVKGFRDEVECCRFAVREPPAFSGFAPMSDLRSRDMRKRKILSSLLAAVSSVASQEKRTCYSALAGTMLADKTKEELN